MRFVAPNDIDGMAAQIDAKTKAIFCESIGNPAGNVADLRAISDLAHAHGVPVIVDNTVPSPYLCRPFEHGCDIVVHALTKYMGGHGTTIGGIVVDSGTFPWAEHAERFPMLNEPDRLLSRGRLYGGARPSRLYRALPGGAAAQHGRGHLAL